jgi:aspartyl protease family protein
MRVSILSMAVAVVVCLFGVVGAEEIHVTEKNGVPTVPVEINGTITLPFVIDSGSSELQISSDVVSTLEGADTISSADFLPGASFVLADGTTVQSARLVLHSVRVGSRVVRNVPASIGTGTAELLLGQSMLKRLGTWSVDPLRQVLIVGGPATDMAQARPTSGSTEPTISPPAPNPPPAPAAPHVGNVALNQLPSLLSSELPEWPEGWRSFDCGLESNQGGSECPRAKRSAHCGGYLVAQYQKALTSSLLLFGSDGKLIRRWTRPPKDPFLSRWEAGWCGDVDGDGVKDLLVLYHRNVVYELSGPSHCCFKGEVWRLTDPPRRTLLVDLNHNPTLVPADIDGRHGHELVTLSVALAYVGGTRFANSPALPRIFQLRDKEWVEATRAFPKVLVREREQTREALAACGGDSGCFRMNQIRLLALSVLLGDWERTRGTLQMSPSDRAWLESVRPKVKRILGQGWSPDPGGSLRAP